jgi:ABC-type antimicrobial peptide transport system permease subunit
MLKNYFKIAWRNLLSNRFYSAVNITGLSAGLGFSFLMASYVWKETRVNSELANAGRQYIIQSKWKNPDMGLELTTLGPLAKALKEQYPGLVANYYRWDGITSNVSKGNKVFREGLQVGDSTLLTMYGFELVYGDIHSAFDKPFSVVITEDRAKKYFGKTDVVGETVTIENFAGARQDFMITGVMKQPRRNSVLYITDNNNNQFYLAEKDLAWFGRDMSTWQNQYIAGYIELQKGITAKDLETPFQQLIKTHAAPDVAANLKPFIVPLKNYYLSANNGTVRKMLLTVSFATLFILLMALVNFVNISVSRGATRLKEIGIRKLLGGMRRQLIVQFLAESFLMTVLSALLGLGIYELSRPWFSNFLEREIISVFSFPLLYWAVILCATAAVGFLAGLYPAWLLSSLRPADAVKGKAGAVKEKVWSRKLLVGFQFGTAAFVLIAAMIISKQTNYFFNKNLGFDKEYIVAAQLPRDWSPVGVQKIQAIRKQFDAMPEVAATSIAFEVMDGNSSGNVQVYQFSQDSASAVAAQMLITDEAYTKTYSIGMAAGSFYGMSANDTFKIVLNETHARALGYRQPQDAVGQLVKMHGTQQTWTISGVTKDFNFGSVQEQIKPVVFMNVLANPIYRYLSIKLKPGNIPSAISALQNKWASLMPAAPFEYSFLDDKLAALYKDELQLKKASHTATVLSIIIVLLGVMGLVALSIQKRIKEIGIRKVLGSSAAGITRLFIKEFVMVFCIASLVTCPLVYWAMQQWLNGYAYRIGLNLWPFAAGVGVIAVLTILLIALQTLKTAVMSPVKNLRTE